MILGDKQQYFQHNVNNNINRPRKMWDEINKAQGTCMSTALPSYLQNPVAINTSYLDSVLNFDCSVHQAKIPMHCQVNGKFSFHALQGD